MGAVHHPHPGYGMVPVMQVGLQLLQPGAAALRAGCLALFIRVGWELPDFFGLALASMWVGCLVSRGGGGQVLL